MYKQYGKRVLDIVIALLALSVLSILMLLIAMWIKFDSRGPVLFKQLRSGRDLKPFTIFKFRSMTLDAPRNEPTRSFTESRSYITKAGKIMRKLSLDELPQLINVLYGDMSIVGPRPVVLKERNLLDLREAVGANTVQPGITGWAQVNGRDALNDIIKARLDGEYIKNFGFKMDLACLIYTFTTVVSLKGHREGHEVDAPSSLLDSQLSSE